jgi:integrase
MPERTSPCQCERKHVETQVPSDGAGQAGDSHLPWHDSGGGASAEGAARRRVCKRADVRKLSPHQLRHGFANRFLRESGRDVVPFRR